MLELARSTDRSSCEVVELSKVLMGFLLVTGGHQPNTGTVRTVGALPVSDHQSVGGEIHLVLPAAVRPSSPHNTELELELGATHSPDTETGGVARILEEMEAQVTTALGMHYWLGNSFIQGRPNRLVGNWFCSWTLAGHQADQLYQLQRRILRKNPTWRKSSAFSDIFE